MAEILGLGITDCPELRLKPQYMSLVIKGNIARGWADKPHLKDPKNWPKEMQEQWGDDEAYTAGKLAQEEQLEQLKEVRAALNDFDPHFIVMLYREGGDVWGNFARPTFSIQAHEQITNKILLSFNIRENYFDRDPDKEYTLKGHREGALHLVRGLQDAGLNPTYTLEPFNADGRTARHNLMSAAVSLDWDRDWDDPVFRRPIVPIGIDPFGHRVRNNEGMTAWDRSAPRPLTPQEAFGLGRSIARVHRQSPWRVALVAAVNWSHANDSGLEYERVHPDVEADARRYEQWKDNEFDHHRPGGGHDGAGREARVQPLSAHPDPPPKHRDIHLRAKVRGEHRGKTR